MDEYDDLYDLEEQQRDEDEEEDWGVWNLDNETAPL